MGGRIVEEIDHTRPHPVHPWVRRHGVLISAQVGRGNLRVQEDSMVGKEINVSMCYSARGVRTSRGAMYFLNFFGSRST